MNNVTKIGVISCQAPETSPSPEQNAWRAGSRLKNYKYVYKTEFFLSNDSDLKYAVLYTYKQHPLTGERYIERIIEWDNTAPGTLPTETPGNHSHGVAAINDPIVVEIPEFPPGIG